MWTSDTTGPGQEKLLLQLENKYPWWQDSVYPEDLKTSCFLERETKAPCVEDLEGRDAALVRTLLSFRDESGIPYFGLTIGRVERHETGTASKKDSYYSRRYIPEDYIDAIDLEMSVVESRGFSLEWADSYGDFDTRSTQTSLGVLNEMIPQSESDLIEWININPKREYTNMMEEITRDWFPEATYFHESEVWVDWEENVDGGTVSLVHAYPVLVVWPLRLTSQVCYEKLS